MTAGRLIRKLLGTYLSLAIFVACLTILFLGMRSVMEIGGACADGGPYVVANPCPKGVGWMLPVSIFAGIASLGAYIAFDSGLPGPKWWGLAWPALFLSLGWNFWEYGLDPPAQFEQGVEWGWIVCGVLFVLMGAGPLIGLASRDARRAFLWADATPVEPRPTARQVARAAKPTVHRASASTGSAAGSAAPAPGAGSATATDVRDLAEDLERLSELYREGQLTDSEFRAAKARLITGGTP